MHKGLAADGFFVAKNRVGLAALAALEKQLSDLFDAFDALPAGVPKHLSRAGQGVLEINHLFTLLPALLAGPVVSRVGEVCAELLGGPVRMTYANAILKPANGGAVVLAHQDTAYDGSSAQGANRYTVWLPFRDTSIDGGTVYYLPGSHRGGSLPHLEMDGVRSLPTLPAECHRAKAMKIAAGGFALHSSAIIHGSYANNSSRARLALSLRLRAN